MIWVGRDLIQPFGMVRDTFLLGSGQPIPASQGTELWNTPNLKQREESLLYRDKQEEAAVRRIPLTTDLKTCSFLQKCWQAKWK